jgi:Raf kinase inhibitor-like YbhB/YbcL family protein
MRYCSIFRHLFFSCFVLLMLVLFLDGSALCLELKSDVFKDGGTIPVRYTGAGEDISPALSWSDAPAGTQSFALIMDDPDAPMGTWVHWVVYDIPKDADGLGENIPGKPVLAGGARQGKNSFHRVEYGGPSPPPGPAHRYIFTLYALDIVLDLAPGAGKAEVLRAMEGHILDKATLTGVFGR